MTNQSDFLETCARDFKIFIDTSSLLEDGAEKFFQNIVPILERERKALIVPLSVVLELKKLAEDPAYCRQKYPDNPNLNKTAIAAFQNIMRLRSAKLLAIHGDPDDGDFADNVFLHVFTKKRMQYNLLLVTQDRALASAATDLGKDSGAVRGVKKILARRINRYGFLQEIFDDNDAASEEIPPNERFAVAKEIVTFEGDLCVSHIPTSGDFVTAVRNNERRPVQLLEELGAGGEGSVFKTNVDGVVAKIYKPEKITRLRHEKLKLMLTKDIDCAGVCFPSAMVLNRREEFVGCLMPAAKGRDLGKSVFMPMLLQKYFPTWNRKDTVQLCVTILQKLKYLHDRNVILGDINPYNILVVAPDEVYFVDTDSYQVEGFICPVGMPLFTPPELQNKPYGLRTLGNENFAVATLLFMIMHPGKSPYAMQDGEGIVENILKGDFAYPFEKLKNRKVPEGRWRFCWSHLTYKIKEAFYHTFRYDGKYHDEEKRPGAGYWLRLFTEYLYLLESGKFSAQDEEALLIFPTRFKKDKNKTYAKCKICGHEFDENFLEQGICRTCLDDGEKYRCARCGCEMVYTNRQRYIDKVARPDICRACLDTNRQRDTDKLTRPRERRYFKPCKRCGKMFNINFLQDGFCNTCYTIRRPSPQPPRATTQPSSQPPRIFAFAWT